MIFLRSQPQIYSALAQRYRSVYVGLSLFVVMKIQINSTDSFKFPIVPTQLCLKGEKHLDVAMIEQWV